MSPGPEPQAPIRLRGHHLLCIHGFRGLGYSPEFVANMSAIVERLQTRPQTAVEIISGPDAICAGCPQDAASHCTEERVSERDRLVLQRLGASPGDAFSWAELVGRVRRRIDPAFLRRACASCPWLPLGYCEEGIAQLQGGRAAGPPPAAGARPRL